MNLISGSSSTTQTVFAKVTLPSSLDLHAFQATRTIPIGRRECKSEFLRTSRTRRMGISWTQGIRKWGFVSGSKDRTWLVSLRVAGLYLLAALLWIPLSDSVVDRIADDRAELNRLQTYKGWLFILLSAALFYTVIQQALRSGDHGTRRFREANAQLELVLQQMPAILWTADSDLILTSTRGKGLSDIGREPDQDVGRDIGELVADLKLKGKLLEAAQAAQGGTQYSYMNERNGIYYETIVAPLLSDEGTQVGVLGFSVNVTEKESLLGGLRQAAEDRQRLVKHLVKAEKDERERIASGIHDDSIQVMTSAGMALDLLLTKLSEPQERELAERARLYVAEAVKRLRTLVFELKPVELDQEGLAAGLRHVLEKSSAEAGFKYEIDDRIFQGLSPESRYSIYRIAQEAIFNIGKHAGASNAKVTLVEENGGIHARVIDDGKGFNPSLPRAGQHFGLREMEQRAELAGGWCRVTSAPGEGTTVDIWTPLVEPEDKMDAEID